MDGEMLLSKRALSLPMRLRLQAIFENFPVHQVDCDLPTKHNKCVNRNVYSYKNNVLCG